jgi:hypothetical protein
MGFLVGNHLVIIAAADRISIAPHQSDIGLADYRY